MAKIDELFDIMVDEDASDLHLLQGQTPKLRLSGRIVPIDNWGILEQEIITPLLEDICPADMWQKFKIDLDIDFAYQKDEKSRFRSNYYWQEHGMAAVFRIIPTKILTLTDLGLPQTLRNLAHLRSGLVLVTGPTGSGKSTTLAAIINEINEVHNKYILTIEEPIEFVHPNKKSMFCQREVGQDVKSFAEGLRTATRQNCDVVLVGEMRDYETVSLALSAASMGSLVFGTLHTNSAMKTIDRVIDVFPHSQQPMARAILADSLRAVVSQLLLKKSGGGRVAVNEILLEAPGMASNIREGNIANLRNIIQIGKKRGMTMMDDAIAHSLDKGLISQEEAYAKAEDKERFDFSQAEDQESHDFAKSAVN
jgi:twitching motility protein PilT